MIRNYLAAELPFDLLGDLWRSRENLADGLME